jgi:ketosteroid isomerase-like protein
MSAENVQLIRRSFEIFARHHEIRWDMLASDIEIRDFDLPDAAGEVFRGHKGYNRWLSIWGSAWDGYELELEEAIDAGDQVIAVFRLRARGRGSGLETERVNSVLFTLRDAKVVRADYFGTGEGAQAAARTAERQSTS